MSVTQDTKKISVENNLVRGTREENQQGRGSVGNSGGRRGGLGLPGGIGIGLPGGMGGRGGGYPSGGGGSESGGYPSGRSRRDSGNQTETDRDERNGNGSSMLPSVTYNLEGEETQAEMPNGARGTVRLNAHWLENQVLELVSVRSFNAQGRDVTITIRDRWTLASDGKSLDVERHTITPKGDETSHLIFTRQS